MFVRNNAVSSTKWWVSFYEMVESVYTKWSSQFIRNGGVSLYEMMESVYTKWSSQFIRNGESVYTKWWSQFIRNGESVYTKWWNHFIRSDEVSLLEMMESFHRKGWSQLIHTNYPGCAAYSVIVPRFQVTLVTMIRIMTEYRTSATIVPWSATQDRTIRSYIMTSEVCIKPLSIFADAYLHVHWIVCLFSSQPCGWRLCERLWRRRCPGWWWRMSPRETHQQSKFSGVLYSGLAPRPRRPSSKMEGGEKGQRSLEFVSKSTAIRCLLLKLVVLLL